MDVMEMMVDLLSPTSLNFEKEVENMVNAHAIFYEDGYKIL